MIAAEQAFCLPGNHDDKLLRYLKGRNVQISHGLAESIAQIEALSQDKRDAWSQAYRTFVDALQFARRSHTIHVEKASTTPGDPSRGVIDALKKLGPNVTAAQFREYLSHLKDYAGIDGIYDFERVPQRGLDVQNAVVTLWMPDKNRWVPVSAPAGAPLK